MNQTNISEWLAANTQLLAQADVESARLDCLLLLEYVLKTDRAHLLAHQERNITDDELAVLQDLVSKRLSHTPMAYLLGHSEFYGRTFVVSENVLVPRPESETILELLQDAKNPSTIIDVGTGSGALAISAKLLFPNADVYATDIDPRCLAVAQQNSSNLSAPVGYFAGNLLEPLPDTAFSEHTVIIANLPYVPTDYPINHAAAHEPSLALFGGENGLDLYQTLWQQINLLHKRPKAVVTESLPAQHEQQAHIAKNANYYLQKTEGLQQLFTLKN